MPSRKRFRPLAVPNHNAPVLSLRIERTLFSRERCLGHTLVKTPPSKWYKPVAPPTHSAVDRAPAIAYGSIGDEPSRMSYRVSAWLSKQNTAPTPANHNFP